MTAPRVLVVEDDPLVRLTLTKKLEQAGYDVESAERCSEAMSLADAHMPDLALLDVRLPDGDGLRVLQHLRQHDSDAVVVLMTGQASVETAVTAMRIGAYDFVVKPLELDRVTEIVAKGLETTRLRREVRQLRSASEDKWGPGAIIGQSASMIELKRIVARVAKSPAATVLVTGESGTGKDLVARALHFGSVRTGRFVNITCSAIPDTLLESELFGHERGAFTDARVRKIGLIEEADGGTLFLDEIGEMSLGLQAKLLRFLEDRQFRRVGGTDDLSVDLRVVAATNRDLESEVAAGRFRADLLYRLRVLEVRVPPLRERTGDVALLTRVFCERFAREFRAEIHGPSPAAVRMLEVYPWPGNVRELKNAVERAVLLAEHPVLEEADFPLQQPEPRGRSPFTLPTGGINMMALEIDLIEQALARTGGNRTRAGALLGMNRDQIRYRIEKYGLEQPRDGHFPLPEEVSQIARTPSP